jgi:diguanylate cyclase (GGDEF)-like protein
MPSHKKDQAQIIDIKESLLNREAEIELLQQTFTEIGGELDLDRVFEITAERARALVNAKTLLVPVIDPGGKTYTYRAGSGENTDEIVGESLSLNYGICGWVFKHEKPWWRGVLDDLNEVERTDWEKEAGTVVLVPLRGKKGLLGGISGINKIDGQEFSRRDFNMLQMFASIVSVAIENAMAVQKMEESSYLQENYRHQLSVLNKQLIESNKELEHLALYDTLTSLPNRSLFRDRLGRAIMQARDENTSVAVLLVDLDKFKNINDVLGHEKGDRLLKGIAKRLLEHVSAEETLARLGGDEFVMILQQSKTEAMQRARELLRALEVPFVIEGAKVVVSGSVGVAIYPQHGHDVSELLRHADSAMYLAKDGKKGAVLYSLEQDKLSLRHLTMVADLHKALEQKEFRLHYQPQIQCSSGRVLSVEALGRWKSPVLGEISPDVFIHELEQSGLIDRYTFWLIETALAQAIDWNNKGHLITISVNISAQDLINPEFTLQLDRIVNHRGNGKHLTFEITESIFLSEHEGISEVLDYIRSLGIELSIDDFGTGYSSLSRLKRMPMNEVKIDKSFIIDMEHDKDNELIVKSIIDLAHNLGLVVVAEGVENKTVSEYLKSLGCDMLQGYYLCKPLSAEKCEYWIAEHRPV